MSDKIKCKDLIGERYQSRNESISKMLMHANGEFEQLISDEADRFIEEYTKTQGEEPSEEAVDKFVEEYYKNTEYNETSIDEFHLGFSKITVVKIELSTGGPADFIEVFLDEDGFINKAIYHYQDWFDGAQMEVQDDDPMMEYVSRFIEMTHFN
jgi:hypothetical protein